MPKLKLGAILDEKPVKLTIELPASVHRDLVAYAEVLTRTAGQTTDPAKLAPHMIARFIASDREFAKLRKTSPDGGSNGAQSSLPGPAIADQA
jgi:hypothetical protein